MRDLLLNPRWPDAHLAEPGLFVALEAASGAFARLDQALDHHPLAPAFLYRTRLEAVRRQAAVDGQSIDPWHLAATLEGLRLRMDHALRLIDRIAVQEAARTALGLHQWITAPDLAQEGEVQHAEQHLAASRAPTALLTAATRTQSWLQTGRARPPIRAALIRYWTREKLLRLPVPLTGPGALSAAAPGEAPDWPCAFLLAIAEEARDYQDLLRDLERHWFAARAKLAGRRTTSRAALAVDLLAAAPLLSATTLARGIGMSIKAATELLDQFVREDIAIEVTHRSARRLFGLAGLAPLRDEVAPPRRPEPGRGPGRPRMIREQAILPCPPPPLPGPPLTPIERKAIDYSDLEHWMAHADQVIRDTRRRLDALAQGSDPEMQSTGSNGGVEAPPSTC